MLELITYSGQSKVQLHGAPPP